MQILSVVGTPMTNAEVFALIRRRRDEREAKSMPPFALQCIQAEMYQSKQFTRGNNDAIYKVNETNSSLSSSELLRNKCTALMSEPMAHHLVVLLLEVQLLNYLQHHAILASSCTENVKDNCISANTIAISNNKNYNNTSLVNNNSEEQLYLEQYHTLFSPSSVYYNNTFDNMEINTSVNNKNVKECSSVISRSNNDNNENVNDAPHNIVSACRSVEECKIALRKIICCTSPGTVAHVRAVCNLLELYERQSYALEIHFAQRIQRVIHRCMEEFNEYQHINNNEENEEVATNTLLTSLKDEPLSENEVDTINEDQKAEEDEHTDKHQNTETISHNGSIVHSKNNKIKVKRSLLEVLQSMTRQNHQKSVNINGNMKRQSRSDVMHNHLHERTTYSQLPYTILSDQELLQVINARPRTALDVYRILNTLDSRLCVIHNCNEYNLESMNDHSIVQNTNTKRKANNKCYLEQFINDITRIFVNTDENNINK